MFAHSSGFVSQPQMAPFWYQQTTTRTVFVERTSMIAVPVPIYIPFPMFGGFPSPVSTPSPIPLTSLYPHKAQTINDGEYEEMDSGVEVDVEMEDEDEEQACLGAESANDSSSRLEETDSLLEVSNNNNFCENSSADKMKIISHSDDHVSESRSPIEDDSTEDDSFEEEDEAECLEILGWLGVTKNLHRMGVLP